jgi:hypothetical protein
VPRLSLIVPFQRDATALETTVVSILESRTQQDELILVHDGDYDDPYQLASDEAVVLETERGSSLAEQLNLAVRAACSPVVQVVLPGTTVEAGWCDEAIQVLEDTDVHTVSLSYVDTDAGHGVFGIDEAHLPHRQLATCEDQVAGPLLSGTVIRRRSLLKLGGWCERIPESLIDLELTLLMRTLAVEFEVIESSRLHLPASSGVPKCSPFELGKGCGMLACAYSELPESHIVVEPLVRRIGLLASGLLNPKIAAERLGWVLGVRDRSWSHTIAERVELASEAFHAAATVPLAKPESRPSVNRRAA